MKYLKSTIPLLLALSACTSTLQPVGTRKDYSAFKDGTTPIIARCSAPTGLTLNLMVSPDTGGDTKRLEWLNCEMLAKSMSNLDQAGWLKNRNEWKDLPLFLSALTAGALVLFGKRTDGVLQADETDILEGLALGTAGFAALSNYVSPDQASQLLYTSAQGHRCLAEHGQMVAAYAPMLVPKDAEYKSLQGLRATLSGMIASTGTDAEKQAARVEVERADRVIAFYLQQKTAKELAPARVFTVAYDFGIELTKSARRQARSIGDFQSAIEQQVRLQLQHNGIKPTEVPASPGGVAKAAAVAVTIADTTRQISLASNALSEGLPDLALLVNGFTLCKSNALAGAALPIAQIRYFGVTDGS